MKEALGVELTLLSSLLGILLDTKLWLFATRNALSGFQSYTQALPERFGGLGGDVISLGQR